MDTCDVLIVGAGPTGLVMAAELVRYGIQCRIIDKDHASGEHSKALAIQPRTMEIFHFLGLSSQFLEKGQKIHSLNLLSEEKPLGHIEFESLETQFPYILSLPQSATEEILIQHLQHLGYQIERDLELVELEETKQGAIAHIQALEGKNFQIETKYILGCDGAHSFVRKHLQLPFEGEAFPIVFSLADIELNWKYSHEEVFAFWNREGVLAAIPLPSKDCYRLIFELDRCQRKHQVVSEDNLQVDIPPPSLGEIESVVKSRADQNASLSNPMWRANFHVNSRLSARYRVGNCFLAGDAAHIHSPVGGQGMNTGIQDAFNLAWKLALTLKGKLSSKVLDSYHEERHAIAKQLLKGTEMGTRLAALKKGWHIALRNTLASLLLPIPPLQQKLIQTVTQLSITYPPSSQIGEKGKFSGGPKPGSRMPNCKIDRENLHDLFLNPDTFYLLLFVRSSTEAEQLETLLDETPIPMKILIVTNTFFVQSRGQLLLDPHGEIHSLFGLQKGGCYVIRPDTYICYRQTPLNPLELRDFLFKSFFATVRER